MNAALPSIALVRIALAAAAGVALWSLFSRIAQRDRRVAIIVGVGLLLRALGGQILFWISWLHLPLAPSLQIGDGFWFFASDGPVYLASASALAAGGPSAILGATTVYPSHVFVQVVAVCVAAFGDVASVALLLNCAAYLATSALIVSLDRGEGGSRNATVGTPCLVALAALSCGPGTLLWSLQLLKDAFFLLLIAAIVAACAWWQALWRADARDRTPIAIVGCAAAMCAITYALGGIRWYFAAIVCAAAAAFLPLVALTARRRTPALVSAAVLLLALAQAARLGGDDDIPPEIRRLLDPRPAAAVVWRPSSIGTYMADARTGFEQTPGATAIAPGARLAPVAADSPRANPKPRAVPSTDAPAVEAADRVGAGPWRLAAGMTALFLPRAAGEALGLIHVGGGRGLWAFAEIDTLAFDAVCLFAAFSSIRALRRRRSRATPLFALLVLLFLMTAVPLAYTVNNFGTLFRLRQMLYLIAALVPAALAAREEAPAAARPSAGESPMPAWLAFSVVAIALLSSAPSAAAQTRASERPADAAAIRAHIESIFKAFIDKDRPKLEATHGAEWRGFTPYSGRVIRGLDGYMTFATFPPGTPKGQGMVGYRLSDFDVVFYGDTAVVCFVADLDVVYGTDKGTQRLTLLDVYHKDPGGWIQVASNTSLHPDEIERIERRQGERHPLSDADRASLLSAREAVWRAWFAGDVDALTKLVPPELITIEPHADSFGTRDSTVAGSRGFAGSGGKLARLAFPRTEIQAYGSTAVIYTTYELELMTGGRTEAQRGTATEFFVQQDGRWINTGWQLAPVAK